MRMRLSIVFALCLFICAVGCVPSVDAVAFGWGSGETHTEDFTKTFPMAEAGQVKAETINGSVTATAWDKPEVDLLVVKRVQGASEADAQKYLDEITIDVKESAEGLDIRIKQPDSHGRINYGANVELRVPKGTSLDLETTNGNVDVSGVGGPVEAESTNGSVTCEDAVRRVDAETTNGNVEVTCGSSEQPLEGVTAESTNGSVTVALPASASFELNAKTVNGNVKNDFGVPVEGKFTNRHAKGKVGDGGPAVNASSTNGNVRVHAMNP